VLRSAEHYHLLCLADVNVGAAGKRTTPVTGSRDSFSRSQVYNRYSRSCAVSVLQYCQRNDVGMSGEVATVRCACGEDRRVARLCSNRGTEL